MGTHRQLRSMTASGFLLRPRSATAVRVALRHVGRLGPFGHYHLLRHVRMLETVGAGRFKHPRKQQEAES